jgi:hypothetical protein
VARRHKQTVVFGAPKAHIGASLWQMYVGDGCAIWGEYTNTVYFFRFSTGGTIAAPTTP